MGASEEMIGTEDAAAWLGVSVQYVRRLAKDGKIQAVRIPGRGKGEWLVSSASLEEMSRTRRARTTPRLELIRDGRGPAEQLALPEPRSELEASGFNEPAAKQPTDEPPSELEGSAEEVAELRRENQVLREALSAMSRALEILSRG